MKSSWVSPASGVKKLKDWGAQLESVLPLSLTPASELVRVLKRDHDDLRKLIKVLKSDRPIGVRRTAYKRFTALLASHSRAEEKAVYELAQNYQALRKKTLEGFVEHHVADMLTAEISKIRVPERWTAAVQVLAELVEHHVEEEEEELFPKLDQALALNVRLQAEARFLALREDTQKSGADAGVLSQLRQ
jgi:hemerythrin superfamily protein